jgi:hypothetical protein
MASELCHPFRPRNIGGRREDRVTAAPMAPVREESTGQEPQVRAGSTGLPCAMVLRLIRDLPGDQALLSPSSADRSADLTPALGRQDHTISPSASCCSSGDTPRPSHPASYVRDDRDTPLWWRRDARMLVLICPTAQAKTARRAIFAWAACVAFTASLRATRPARDAASCSQYGSCVSAPVDTARAIGHDARHKRQRVHSQVRTSRPAAEVCRRLRSVRP